MGGIKRDKEKGIRGGDESKLGRDRKEQKNYKGRALAKNVPRIPST